MNIEELKLLIEAFGGFTDSAAWAFLVWIGYQYFVALLTSGTILGLFYFGLHLIGRILRAAPFNREIAGMLGCSYCGDLNELDAANIKRRIQSLLDKEGA